MEYAHRRGIIGIPIMLTFVYLFYSSGPPWDTPFGAAAIYSALAFLCITMSVSSLNLQRIDDTPANAILTGTTAYGFIIFAGSALYNIFQTTGTVSHSRPAGIFLNLTALAATGFFIFLYAWNVGQSFDIRTQWTAKNIEILIITAGAIYTLLFTFLTSIGFPVESYIFGGYFVGGIAVGTYLLAAGLLFRKRRMSSIADLFRLSVAAFFMAIASMVHVYILAAPSSFWVLTMGLIGMTFIYATVAITYPYLMSIGVSKRRAYVFAVGICLTVILPFLLAAIVDSIIPVSFFVSLPLSVSIHFGASLFVGGSAYLIFARSEESLAPWLQPISLLLTFWAIAEFFVAISPIFPMYPFTESVMPYVAGSIVATLLLWNAYRQTLSPHPRLGQKWSRAKILFLITGFIALLILSETVRLAINSMADASRSFAVARVLMLSFSYLSLFALLNLFFALAGYYGGRLMFDANLAALSTIWVVVVILRANFEIWSIGWWASEVFLYGGMVICILYFLESYLQEVKTRADLKKRFQIQKTLLAPELIRRIHQSTDYVEMLGTEIKSEERLEIVSKALNELSRAETIAENLNFILIREGLPKSALEPIDLVDLLHSVISPAVFGCSPTIESSAVEHVVLSNRLLADAIRSVLNLVVQRIGRIVSLPINITQKRVSGKHVCNLHFVLEIETDNAFEKQEMLMRYASGTTQEITELAYAQLLLFTLNGKLDFAFETKSRNRLLVEIDFLLPAVVESSDTERS